LSALSSSSSSTGAQTRGLRTAPGALEGSRRAVPGPRRAVRQGVPPWPCAMGARAAAARMPSVPLALAAGLAWAAPAGGAGEGETCAADGRGCVELPAFPDCEHSCGRRRCLASGSGNTERVWPACPSGPDGCRDCADKNQDCPRFARSFRGHGCSEEEQVQSKTGIWTRDFAQGTFASLLFLALAARSWPLSLARLSGYPWGFRRPPPQKSQLRLPRVLRPHRASGLGFLTLPIQPPFLGFRVLGPPGGLSSPRPDSPRDLGQHALREPPVGWRYRTPCCPQVRGQSSKRSRSAQACSFRGPRGFLGSALCPPCRHLTRRPRVRSARQGGGLAPIREVCADL
ncbi:unnamed protein product, partial [Prorocentrum cordatum]